MPYIKPERRPALDNGTDGPANAGELNYLITRLIFRYWQARGNYAAIADVTGALQNAEAEFYRRVAVPYEDSKIDENGDVYE